MLAANAKQLNKLLGFKFDFNIRDLAEIQNWCLVKDTLGKWYNSFAEQEWSGTLITESAECRIRL